MLKELNRHFGMGFAGEVIPNGVDPLPRSTGPKRRRILSVGRIWDEAKNIRLLDSVAAEVLWPIVTAGPLTGPDGAELHPRNLECLGRLSAEGVREELAGASIYAAPALYEPFGLAIQEAALSECALVLSDIPSLRELWDGVAVFVDPNDETAWRRALNDLIEDPRRRAVLAARALDRARSRGVAGMAVRYHALYARMTTEGDFQSRRLAA
jgi:glycosyltransferase involved in cell wall biosynthesis